jgi:GTPase
MIVPEQDMRRDDMRAVVLVPVLKESRNNKSNQPPKPERLPESRLEEAIGLARAIDLEIVHGAVVFVNDPRPATLIGTGKIEEIKAVLDELDAGLVIVDHPLTPVQQRNLEREWNAKVIDRTGLILEIFGRRASTKEGRLQVELAHLNYQKGRLVRSWTHLERQRGGAGFMGGPGETQIEADRRRSCVRASCIAPSAARCRIRSSLSRAIPMPANRRSSTASPAPAFSPRTCCLPPSIRPCVA